MVTVMYTSFVLAIAMSACNRVAADSNETTELPTPLDESKIYYVRMDQQYDDQEARVKSKNISALAAPARVKKIKKNSTINEAIRAASLQGFNAMIDLYERKEPEILRKGETLNVNHPATQLSLFSAPMTNESDAEVKGAYAGLYAAKKLQESLNLDFTGLGRQASKKRISLKRTSLEGLCPPREAPSCLIATRRYRTHDGTCNNLRKLRWGSAQLPFHRFLAPEYSDGLESIRKSVTGGALPSARFVSLVVHGYREEEAPITMMLPQWGQLIDHDLTATLQPRSINGSIPSCCRSEEPHPSCLPITVPNDDPFLGSLGVRCLEFLRSAPAQRRDCFLSWREQTNQVTSYIDASPVYSSNPRTADSARTFRDGLLLFGRGAPRDDACLRGAFDHNCIRPGDARAGEQPGLLAMHNVFVAEHNSITLELSDLNPHWSDEKLYQETRRIIGAIFQHVTIREFLPLVLGKEVCRLFDLEPQQSGFYKQYDPRVNPTIANAFSAAAFRFGHSLVQSTIMRSNSNHQFLSNNVSLHEENSFGDIGGVGSLHRILRGMATQRTLKRDEFMSPELTNHLFQSGSFPFGMDLAAINIQRGRDHGLPAYIDWRQPCGLSTVRTWEDLEVIAGPKSAERMRKAYGNIEDIDLFVGGIAERPVVGGLVGPTFACIIAQQFSNLRKGDKFWYENSGFESSFTPAQLFSIRQVTLSQILCRSLGNTNFIQPHAFLPPEFSGNERLRCGEGILAPMDLSPWNERDPFHKEGDLPSVNHIELNNGVFSTAIPSNIENVHVTSQNPIAQLDFGSEAPVLITARPSSPNKKTTVDNKLDLPTSTTQKPKKKRTTTRRPFPTIVDNKLDFEEQTSTTRPNSPFSKLGKNTQTSRGSTTKVKRSTSKIRKPPKISPEPRDLASADNVMTKIFINGDNATKYLNNRPVKTRLDDALESRVNPPDVPYRHNYDNDFDNRDNPYRPTYDYNSRPYYPLTETTKRPYSFPNKRPNYQNTDFVDVDTYERPTRSPISNIHSTPFSYDTHQAASMSPHINYENMAIPLYISPNRLNNRPTFNRPTTRKMDFSTFLFVETTKRTTTSPDFQLSYSTDSPSFFYLNKFPSFAESSSGINDDTDGDSTNLSYFVSSNTNKVSIKHSSHDSLKPFSSDLDPPSVFSHDHQGGEFDGYLRPETSFYIPVKEKDNDISKYNQKSTRTTKTSKTKYFYVKNVLHKSDDGDEGLYKHSQTKRYAQFYDEGWRDKDHEDNIRTMTEVDNMQNDMTMTVIPRSRNRGQNIFLVPFQVLTKIERPDNWVKTDATDIDFKSRLPEVPQLMQDSDVTKELPKPFFFNRRRHSNEKV